MRRGGTNTEGRRVLWLVGVVLCGGRRFILQVNGVCAKTSVCVHAVVGGLAAAVPARIICGRVILAHVQLCIQESS